MPMSRLLNFERRSRESWSSFQFLPASFMAPHGLADGPGGSSPVRRGEVEARAGYSSGSLTTAGSRSSSGSASPSLASSSSSSGSRGGMVLPMMVTMLRSTNQVETFSGKRAVISAPKQLPILRCSAPTRSDEVTHGPNCAGRDVAEHRGCFRAGHLDRNVAAAHPIGPA
jgi:hypothetical protein